MRTKIQRLLFKASRSLNSKSLRSIYFALVHPYIKYEKIAWASTNKAYLNRILGKQKQAARIMSSDGISIPSRLLMKELNISNVYQINIIQHLLFIFKVKSSITSRVFNQEFSLIDHLYPTRFSDNSFKICDFNLKLIRFQLVLDVQQYGINFLHKVKSVILGLTNLKTRSKEKF